MSNSPANSAIDKVRTLRSEQRDAWFALGVVLLTIATCAVLAWIARLQIVEPEAVAQACMTGEISWQCSAREWLVFGFTRNVFGVVAVLAGLLASVSRWRSVALLAIASGVVGAILYHYELSGIGVVLGALVLVREFRPSSQQGVQDSASEHHAQAAP